MGAFTACGSTPTPSETTKEQASADTGPIYVGCFTDDPNRALSIYLGTWGNAINCAFAAYGAGKHYYGLQDGGQCFAGDAPGYVQVPDSECNIPCSGVPSLMCGGAWRNSIYYNPNVKAPPTATQYVGCFVDSPARMLRYVGENYNIEDCAQAAVDAGVNYAGLQWYGQCFVGDTLNAPQVSDSECDTPCNRAPSETCGGSWRNSVYQVTR
jgi:hypothetical protein